MLSRTAVNADRVHFERAELEPSLRTAEGLYCKTVTERTVWDPEVPEVFYFTSQSSLREVRQLLPILLLSMRPKKPKPHRDSLQLAVPSQPVVPKSEA